MGGGLQPRLVRLCLRFCESENVLSYLIIARLLLHSINVLILHKTPKTQTD